MEQVVKLTIIALLAHFPIVLGMNIEEVLNENRLEDKQRRE